MARDGSSTRERIMDVAQSLIMERGFAGVSIDSIIEEIGITKGAFFYHFKSKADLAHALVKRFRNVDAALYEEYAERARKLSRNPLQSVLIFIGLFEELFEKLDSIYPGCLVAAYIYEFQQFDERTQSVIYETFLFWRKIMKDWFDEIVEQHPPKIEVDTTYLADMFTSTFEGAFIMAKGLNDKKEIPQQLRQYKNYIELLFT